jgi:hypothetical protein
MGEPVELTTADSSLIAAKIPSFERRPFALGAVAGPSLLALNFGENPYKDMIVRLPLGDAESEVPVGVVSKSYKLVQHTILFASAAEAFQRHGIKPEEIEVVLRLTKFGGRMSLEFRLPERFDFHPAEGESLKLCFHCFNSVDGSMKLFLAFGWFRFVCANGVLVGTAHLRHRMIHNEFLELPDLAIVLADGLAAAEDEKQYYSEWIKTRISTARLAQWVDGPLKKKWKPSAAARVFQICTTGFDGKYVDAFEEASPSQKQMTPERRVPGSPELADNAYEICQALSWVATQKTDVGQQLEFTRQIPELMQALVKKQ